MRKSLRLVSMISASAALALGGVATVNEVANISITEVASAATTSITLPKSSGYTKANILKANNGKLSSKAKKALVRGSMIGMKTNNFSDNDSSDDRVVTVTNLSESDKDEISKYALSVINSARAQMGKRPWTYSKSALKFADQVAINYNKDGASCWDSDHDVAGIKRAAKACGLNYTAGQVYEDEAGLPITSEWSSNKRSMKVLKEQIYFNIKQMLFGGFSGNDYNDASRYFEWEHAGDLLGLRSYRKGFDAPTKYFAVSFSSLDNRRISVHMIGVAPRYILNYKKFNH
ncbi:SEC10/PgrA surface exclusion domain-containing protein [Lactobacillus kalixensis]|uniref:SEC10/PgrA surface exclusion domain-containing protein n=1 Tax=Lactobacillus kalixensis DSM 16043 TaxID=1423763 RepID=A0A0R1UGS7_9LACO|nr:SEC10/PgrA surface exclusion domain-containing protein [Lactobacillus kalixensis]KRL89826.1 hypothetical protein FC46_GL000559 [Lactobacillus kalixensis DSM 16043]